MTEVPDAAQFAALQVQIDDLRAALDAVVNGAVDAVIAGEAGDAQVYSLVSADRPYRLLVEEMTEGALTVSSRGIVLYANATMVELLGRDPRTLLGSPAADLIAQKDSEALATLLDLAPGERDRKELTLRGSHGPIPVRASASCLDLEGITVHCLVITDLRGQKALEARLRSNERRLGQFLDAVPIGLRITDPQAVSQFGNAEARRLLALAGLSVADGGGIEESFVESVSGTPVNATDLPLAQALRGETSHTDGLDLRGPTGIRMPMGLWGTSIRDDLGAVEFGIVAMADDFSVGDLHG